MTATVFVRVAIKACQREGCGEQEFSRGLCLKHYRGVRAQERLHGRVKVECVGCEATFVPRTAIQRYCTKECARRTSYESKKRLGRVECSETDCTRPVWACGLCNTHYRAAHRAGRLPQQGSVCERPGCEVRFFSRSRWKKYCSSGCQRLVASERKIGARVRTRRAAICGHCGEAFERASSRQTYCGGWSCNLDREDARAAERNRRCKGLGCSEFVVRSGLCRRHYNRHYSYRRKYGLSFDSFMELLAAQSYRCGLCRRGFDDEDICEGYVAVDHCHCTGRVRGILHHGCNQMLGASGERAADHLAAAEYLCCHRGESFSRLLVAYSRGRHK